MKSKANGLLKAKSLNRWYYFTILDRDNDQRCFEFVEMENLTIPAVFTRPGPIEFALVPPTLIVFLFQISRSR